MRTIDQLNADPTLRNASVQLAGERLLLWYHNRLLTTFPTRTGKLVAQVSGWCAKNGFRCEAVRKGRIWI
jgi:hypothetical protein